MSSLAEISGRLQTEHAISSLPIVVLHVHSRCNCRCTMCDIWQTKETRELSAADVQAMLPSFRELSVRWVVLTGGEPLLNCHLASICGLLRNEGIKVTVLTTGLSLSRYAESAGFLFDEIIVSIDGPPTIHNLIRRVDKGYERIAEGLRAIRGHAPNLPLRARTTVQKANHEYLRETVRAAKMLPLNSISFLAADLTSEAFNRKLTWPVARQDEIGLSAGVIDTLDEEVERLILEFKQEIRYRFISETPDKLRRIVQHFRARLNQVPYQAPLCNAPWTSAVIELDGNIRPCFFQPAYGNLEESQIRHVINSETSIAFRSRLDVDSNPICQKCVCSLNYRKG